MISSDFVEASQAYRAHYKDSPFFETWIPKAKFLNADFDEIGNISIAREDDGIYGVAIGTSPSLPDNWKNFSIETRALSQLPSLYKPVAEWDCYWSPTFSGDLGETVQSSDEAISAFLNEHAPDSSVFPGNSEILRWVEINHDNELAAVAALCRWESGRVVISSVATDTQLRGRGLGKQLMQKCLITAAQLGEDYVSLGVRHGNESAQRLYRATGFRLMHNFTYCERR